MGSKIGVILCKCGGQISKSIDIDILSKEIEGLEDINKLLITDNLCKTPFSSMKEEFTDCDRILFAGCSERTSLTFSEERIRKFLREIGIDPALYEVANIREQCAWIHRDGTDKAIDIVKMAYVKLKSNTPALKMPGVVKKVLIIGGGPAGVQAAKDLAEEGIETTLVESKSYLGGHACQIPFLLQCEGWPSMCVSECVVPVQTKNLIFDEKVNVFTSSEIEDIWKENGNFRAKIKVNPKFVDPNKCVSCGKCVEVCPEVGNPSGSGDGMEIYRRKAIDKDFAFAIPDSYNINIDGCTKCGKCVEVCPENAIDLEEESISIEEEYGAVILATGFDSFDLRKIKGLNYGDNINVISSLEMENRLNARFRDSKPKHVVFQLCTGSRTEDEEEGMPYCSKTCCGVTVKQIEKLTQMSPTTEITVLYNNDIRTYGRSMEQLYNNSKLFVEFVNGRVSSIEKSDIKNGFMRINLKSPSADESIEADLVVLAEAQVPGNFEIAEKLGLKLDRFNYPIENQPRILRPTESFVDRVFVVGAASGPKIIQESVEQGSVAALRAIQSFRKEPKKFISTIDGNLCSSCEMCVKACPHGAISIGEESAVVDPAFCQGCGLCVSTCPSRAVQLTNFYDKQILDQAEVAFESVKEGEPKILALLCYWCSYSGADMAGHNRIELPTNFRSIRIRCSSSVNSGLLIDLFRKGVDGIIVAGCPPKNCHHLTGNYMAAKRIRLMNMLMSQMGISPSRLKWEYIGAPEYGKFEETLKRMNQALKRLKPIVLEG